MDASFGQKTFLHDDKIYYSVYMWYTHIDLFGEYWKTLTSQR